MTRELLDEIGKESKAPDVWIEIDAEALGETPQKKPCRGGQMRETIDVLVRTRALRVIASPKRTGPASELLAGPGQCWLRGLAVQRRHNPCSTSAARRR
jgi:hypothetical protein